MSSPHSHPASPARRCRADTVAERASGRCAAALTVVLVAALHVALLLPTAGTGAAPSAPAGPLAVELRRLVPPEPPQQARPPADEARKLLAGHADPDRLAVREPEATPPEPAPEQPAPPTPPEQARPQHAPPKPASGKTPSRPAAQSPPASAMRLPGEERSGSGAASAHDPEADARAGRGSGGPAGSNGNDEVLAALLKAVERHKKYPLQARRTGREGRATLRVRIGADGRVAACSLARPSGVGLLDAATERLGRSLLGLDIPPARGRAMDVLIPVDYALQK